MYGSSDDWWGWVRWACIALKIFITALPPQLYGFPGRQVTLTCPGSAPDPIQKWDRLAWSKFNTYEVKWDKIITVLQAGSTRPYIETYGHFNASRCSVDALTGRLTIHSFTIDDKGVYRCEWLGHPANEIKLLLYGNYSIDWTHCSYGFG